MKHGDQRKISKLAGVTEESISYILAGKRVASRQMAIKLSDAAKAIGLNITPEDWVFRATSIKDTKPPEPPTR